MFRCLSSLVFIVYTCSPLCLIVFPIFTPVSHLEFVCYCLLLRVSLVSGLVPPCVEVFCVSLVSGLVPPCVEVFCVVGERVSSSLCGGILCRW
ncbi:hypothetical protein J4Q44_G00036480 [Coregonus suidteri]|uniref:Uncharacterized protein n=1 Tax=Coregonus suidteri TaxID=861788 RepID=A0AAN8MII5_9TELE